MSNEKKTGKKLRIDKILSHLGIATRSESKKLVKQGRVAVDGSPIKDSGLQVDPESALVEVDGQPVRYREFVYLLLNKPQGVVSATEDRYDRTVIDLLDAEYLAFEPFPVGRLDKDTEGLLLLTNDGKLAHELLSPRKHVSKTYEAVVFGAVDESDGSAFRAGVELDDGYRTMPAELEIVRRYEREGAAHSDIRLTIMEGKFHQVKRMFEAVGKKVVFLKRVSMGPLLLDPALSPGQYRELSEEELTALRDETSV
ncbi:pseudouridine synthase [Saccharibacillus alkalitolerans]|uniref:Pseudouridine synthase n=1 Tax=Saccharibacillus alkalitolerans TaxID=2705290 RepID=A0ABX0F414_9BACL|nr:pseudouridine synthase [Saccharibacillus alkalitolerans]NGZ75691.1 rRNA pseudouridine synthase [Saccharibacillus alkalitolerans]